MSKTLLLLLTAGLLTGCQTLSSTATHQPDAQQGPAEAQSVATSETETTLSIPVVAAFPETEEPQVTVPETSPKDALDVTTPVTPASTQTQASPASQLNAEPDLWQLTRENFALEHGDNKRIQAQLNWYKKHPKYIARVNARASRYYHYVIQEVIERGLPAELALLPIVESAFDPFAYSHGRAAGPWQFIPMTAKRFKLKHSWWYDGRRDIRASTKAALDYLELLNNRFDGDWLLALAAYNSGGGNVSKSVRKNRQRNKPIDFWSLDLPRETRAYVPKLIALAKLYNDPQAYGLSLKPFPNQPYFAAVDTGSQIDLAKAAELANVSIEELYLLNPGFNQWATDPDGPHELLVPYDKATSFSQALQEYPADQRVSWARYKVQSGDSLIRIAKQHNTTADTLRSTNSIRGNNIRIGQMLLIPRASENAKTYVYSQSQRQEKKNQQVALRSGKTKLNYTVRSGDSFWKIGRDHGVGTRQLAAWNQMAPGDPLKIGQKLVIWQQTGTVSNRVVAGNNSDRKVIRKVGYKVRNGDSFARIASKFNVSLSDIKRWNSKAAKAKYLKPGQHLTLYVDVTQAR
ncbi:MAG: LysM peptidoglycan-binding domain-containing protein [Motiliproteus sp.]